MRSRREGARTEWLEAHLAEATRLATLLTADPIHGPRVAEEALAASLQLAPSRRAGARRADVLLAEIVRRSLADPRRDEPREDDRLEALRRLPRRQRAALVLRHYAELSDDRAALFVGCSARALSDLAAKALRGVPVDARADVREWLDAAPAPRHLGSSERHWVLRRSRRQRVARIAGISAVLVAGVVAGLRVPALVETEDPPDAADQLRLIRQVLEAREDSLPFDPDDAGPGTTRMFTVVDGVVGGNVWNVRGYRDSADNPCLQLVVGFEFGTRRCMGPGRGPIEALVDFDEKHDATFISGMVAPHVASLHFVGPGVSLMDVTIGRERPDARGPQDGFFGIALPDRLLPVESREAGRKLGYHVMRGHFTAMGADGKPVAELDLLLAQRR